MEFGNGPYAQSLEMTDEEFCAFYKETARPLWGYLVRISGVTSLADDLMQEAFLRLLESTLPSDASSAHRRNYLFRIATNLLNDHFRSRRFEELTDYASDERMADKVERKIDVETALDGLRNQDKEMLWLAYVEGDSHEDIADMLGYKSASVVRSLLLRARKQLVKLLGRAGQSRGGSE